jgi:hypothetical protein
MCQQFKTMRRPLEGAPRESLGHLNGFKKPAGTPLAKLERLFAERDSVFADIDRRLTNLEKSAGIVKAVTP